MTNTGKDFEALTEQVFARLLAQRNLLAKVQRNTVIEGQTTSHQIDVSFEFAAGPFKYLTLVECKDWGAPVPQEKVFAFQAVLQDIPGQSKGIMVARSGFQEGARQCAAAHGIELYELREPRDEDWEGLIREIACSMTILIPTFRIVRPIPDKAWMKQEAARQGLPGLALTFSFNPEEVVLRYESGTVCDLKELLLQHLPKDTCDWTLIRHDFPERLMVPVAEGPVSFCPAIGLQAEVRVEEMTREFTFRFDHLIAYCFRDVLKGEVHLLDRRVSAPEPG